MEYPGNNLEKLSASSGTFLIEQKIDCLSGIIEPDCLAVLSAYVNDCPGRRKKMIDPRGMTGNIRGGLI